MKKIFALILVFILLFCSCQNKRPEEPDTPRPMICFNTTYYVNPYIPVTELPEGYEYAGIIDEEMAYNTGLEGTEYYTNSESDYFYTYQMTGTFIGNNTVDTTKLSMHYVQWIPIDEE